MDINTNLTKRLLSLILLISIFACTPKDDEYEPFTVPETSSSSGCGTYNGHTLYKGSQGGCYYINSSGNKQYVDRSYCNC